jgi:radical SAM PhpK family P-methyltransferase
MKRTDCILIGFNELDFDDFAATQKQFSATSAAFSELQTNSVLMGTRRLTYMDLLNQVLTHRSGVPSQLSAFRLPSLGVAYLACYLQRRGFSAEIVNYFNAGRDEFAQMLAESPRSVAITTTYYVDDEPIRDIIRFVREHNESVPIIVGGPRVFNVCTGQKPAVRDLLLKSVGADIYIYESQGERTLSEVVAALREDPADLSRVPNLIYRQRDGSMARTRRLPENNNLDENAIDWSYFGQSFYTPTTYMRTSRSCSFQCAFCNYPAMAGELALSDLSTIERELCYLADFGTQNIIFVDDTFNVPLPRFKKICRMMIKNKLGLRWVSFFRCSNSDDEAFDLMAEAGCTGAFLGIESGDQRILQNMRKFAKLERYAHGIAALRERGIVTLTSLVLGFPGETEESVRNTLDFINNHRPTYYNVQLYYHDVLAPVEREREAYGIEGSGYSWKHMTMSWQEAIEHKTNFIRGVTGTALLPLYGLSIWALPYLMSNGIDIDQATRFAHAATKLLLKGLDTDYVDPAGWTEELDAALGHPVSQQLAGGRGGNHAVL